MPKCLTIEKLKSFLEEFSAQELLVRKAYERAVPEQYRDSESDMCVLPITIDSPGFNNDVEFTHVPTEEGWMWVVKVDDYIVRAKTKHGALKKILRQQQKTTRRWETEATHGVL